MELILQQNLPHQQNAIDAICKVFDGVQPSAPVQFYENPKLSLQDPRLSANIRELQKAIPAEYRSSAPIGNCLNLDIKMETGTGKTYVYTKTIFELHKRYGFNKFIIAVPSLAIKAGTAQFLKDAYVKRHLPMVAVMVRKSKSACLKRRKRKKDVHIFRVLSVISSKALARVQRKFTYCWLICSC